MVHIAFGLTYKAHYPKNYLLTYPALLRFIYFDCGIKLSVFGLGPKG